nr:unnamed protein product [Callosobruchus chinensis]
MSRTTLRERRMLVNAHERGVSTAELASQFGISQRQVQNWVKRHREGGEGGLETDRTHSHRPNVLSQDDVTRLLEYNSQHRFSSTATMKIRLGLNCCKKTICNYLHKNGIHKRSPAVKPMLSGEHRRRRLQFCQENLNRDWSNVVFSDEKMFSTSLDHRPPLWRPNNTRYDPANVIPSRRSGRSTMGYWGWMTSDGPGDLVEINDKMNSQEYVDILENGFIPSYRILYPEGAVNFVQDNSAVHTAHIVRNYLAQNSYNVIAWPAKSPDLDPIENLWGIMVKRWETGDPLPNSRQNLNLHCRRIWESFRGSDVCRNLVGSMQRRLQACIDAEGGYTKYW